MVAAISGRLTAQVDWLGLRVGGQSALSLHSSNELGELSQWLCHDDSTTNIISVITIILLYVHQDILCHLLSQTPRLRIETFHLQPT